MKTFYKDAMRKVPVFLCGALMTLLSACGDDSKTSSRAPEEESLVVDESSSSSVQKESSSSLEAIVDVVDGPVVEADSIDVSEYLQEGSVLDKRNKRSYDLLISEIDIWTNENIDYKTTSPKSTCYDYKDSLCVKYGRLYSNADKEVCPEGFRLPRVEDFWLLVESKKDYNAQYAGYCKTRSYEPIACYSVGDTAFYVTQDDSLVAISKNGSLNVLKNDGRFASVRCMKERSIVEKQNELPKCVEGFSGRTVFVTEKKSAYSCNGSEWESVERYSACKDGEKYAYSDKTDYLYVCADGMWRMAALNDIGRPCIDENRHENVVFNGDRYACSKSGWVKLTYPASQLGECYSEHFGTVAVTTTGPKRTYVCRNTGTWEIAGPVDVYGRCASRIDGQIVTLDSVQWYCNTKFFKSYENYDWVSNKGNVNEMFGFCTDENLGDTAIYNDVFYRCNMKHVWEQYKDEAVLPYCNEARWDTVYNLGHKEYWCSRIAKNWQLLEHRLFDGQKDSVSCNMENYGKIYSWYDTKYICSLNKNLLRFNKASETELKFGACGLDTVYAITEDGVYYSCRDGVWSNRQLETCEAKFGWCSKGNDRTEVYADSGCFCNDGSWKNRQLKIVETEFDEICEKGKDYIIFYGDQKYTCDDGYISSIAIFSSDYDEVFGKCEGENQGKDTVYYGLRFVCDTTLNTTPRNNWYRYREADSLAGTYCHNAIKDLVVVLRDSSYVACNGRGTWITKDYSKYMSECNEDNEGLVEYNGVTNSVCRSGRWVPADTFHVTDKRDGKEYAAITIDGVTWMAEPLRYVPEGKSVYVESSIYPVSAEDVKDDELVYYSWIVAMNLDEKYEKGFAKGSVIKSNTVVQGACMEGWHIPRYDEIKQKLTDKIYYRLQGYKKVFDDDDIVGIHFTGRTELVLGRDTVAGIDSVFEKQTLALDYMWTVDETDNLYLRSSRNADVAVIRKNNGLDDMTKLKYGVALVRCVKDY